MTRRAILARLIVAGEALRRSSSSNQSRTPRGVKSRSLVRAIGNGKMWWSKLILYARVVLS